MNAFNPTFKDLKSNLKNMLLKKVLSVEDGFEILDIDLEIDENLSVDVLAKDAKGNPAVVLMTDLEETNLIQRLLSTLCGLRKHRFLLQRIYRDHEFDFSVPPRMLLLSPRFSDDFIEKLDFIVAGDIVPYEYFTLKIGDKEFLTFTRRDIDEEGDVRAYPIGEGKEEPPPQNTPPSDLEIKTIRRETPAPAPEPPKEAPAPPPEPPKEAPAAAKGEPDKKGKEKEPKDKKKDEIQPFEKYFHEAKKKILRISNEIIEAVDGPVSRFKIGNQVLVTLSKENDVLSLHLGDTDEKSYRIDSESQLNEALNLIFKRYFTAFSSISKS